MQATEVGTDVCWTMRARGRLYACMWACAVAMPIANAYGHVCARVPVDMVAIQIANAHVCACEGCSGSASSTFTRPCARQLPGRYTLQLETWHPGAGGCSTRATMHHPVLQATHFAMENLTSWGGLTSGWVLPISGEFEPVHKSKHSPEH